LRKLSILFSTMAVLIYISTTECKVSLFFTSLPAVLTGFWFAFPLLLVKLRIVSYACWTFVWLLLINVKVFAYL
jgi:hypothetical protein